MPVQITYDGVARTNRALRGRSRIIAYSDSGRAWAGKRRCDYVGPTPYMLAITAE